MTAFPVLRVGVILGKSWMLLVGFGGLGSETRMPDCMDGRRDVAGW